MSRLPKLCRHKASGKAYVTDPYTRREHYFRASYGSPECRREYDEWVRQLLDRRRVVASGAPPGSSVTVGRLIVDFMAHARTYYVKDGKETSQVSTVQAALRPVNNLFGTLPADDFGPDQLKAARQWMIGAGWIRQSINSQVQRIRQVFRWGVEHGLVRTETLAALKTVPGLRFGRSAAVEATPVEPVPLEVVERTLPRLSSTVREMVEVQLHADMRPGEVTIMRPCDIDRRDVPWLYVPCKHKTQHHGKQRRIYLGPKARAILAPLILKCPSEEAWLFQSKCRGPFVHRRSHWTVKGYDKAIYRACRKSPAIPDWTPGQLRHTQATVIRAAFGAEAAQVILGHSQLETSQIYAERNEKLARDVAEKIG